MGVEVQSNSKPESLWDRRLLCVMLASVTVGTNYTAINPFYPKVAHDLGIRPALIGVIMAAMPFSSLVLSPAISRRVGWLGRLNSLILSILATVTFT